MRYEAFVQQAAIGIEVDQITIVRYAARANERRQALIVGAANTIEHLIDHSVDAAGSDVIERNAGRQRVREREAGIIEALITEAWGGFSGEGVSPPIPFFTGKFNRKKTFPF